MSNTCTVSIQTLGWHTQRKCVSTSPRKLYSRRGITTLASWDTEAQVDRTRRSWLLQWSFHRIRMLDSLTGHLCVHPHQLEPYLAISMVRSLGLSIGRRHQTFVTQTKIVARKWWTHPRSTLEPAPWLTPLSTRMLNRRPVTILRTQRVSLRWRNSWQ